MYLWFKLLHIFFIVSWFAGLFYLPRLYVNLAMAEGNEEYARLLLMAQKLYKFMLPWAIGALLCGLGLLHLMGWHVWTAAKLSVGIALAAYHVYCGVLLRRFEQNTNVRSHRWFRVFNEIPVLFLLAALYFAIFKPA